MNISTAREHALCDLSPFEFIQTYSFVQNMVYLDKWSVNTWKDCIFCCCQVECSVMSIAAVINDHKLSGLNQQICYLSVLEVKTGWQGCLLLKALGPSLFPCLFQLREAACVLGFVSTSSIFKVISVASSRLPLCLTLTCLLSSHLLWLCSNFLASLLQRLWVHWAHPQNPG